MVKLDSNATERYFETFSGPLVEDGAPYSGIGLQELNLISPYLRTQWNQKVDPLPDPISDRTHRQYGSGNQSSQSRRMLGSVVISALLTDGTMINIRHVAIEGSSRWIVGRNVTAKCDIIRTHGNFLKHPSGLKIPTQNVDLHSYIPLGLFFYVQQQHIPCFRTKLFCAAAQIEESIEQRPWEELKKIVDKVHKHVCGHAKLSGIQILLERNQIWSAEVEKYLNRVIQSCENCARTHEPKQSRKLSLSSLNRSFNELVCTDHFHLGNLRMCHILCASTRYSAGSIVPDTEMESAIIALDSHWISQF